MYFNVYFNISTGRFSAICLFQLFPVFIPSITHGNLHDNLKNKLAAIVNKAYCESAFPLSISLILECVQVPCAKMMPRHISESMMQEEGNEMVRKNGNCAISYRGRYFSGLRALEAISRLKTVQSSSMLWRQAQSYRDQFRFFHPFFLG